MLHRNMPSGVLLKARLLPGDSMAGRFHAASRRHDQPLLGIAQSRFHHGGLEDQAIQPVGGIGGGGNPLAAYGANPLATLGGFGGGVDPTALIMLSMLGLALAEMTILARQQGLLGPAGAQGPAGAFGPGISPFGGVPGFGSDSSFFSPLARNGVPVVTEQNKSQAILGYLQDHAQFSSVKDLQILGSSLEKLTPGQLNLLFQSGTTFAFGSGGQGFQQNTLGLEQDRRILINERAIQSTRYDDQTKQQIVLHEIYHALDDAAARAVGSNTELLSQRDPAVAAASQNYRNLASQGLVNWDSTLTDPRGIYPAAADPAELFADAGKIVTTDPYAALRMRFQDPLTFNAIRNEILLQDALGNRLAGLA